MDERLLVERLLDERLLDERLLDDRLLGLFVIEYNNKTSSLSLWLSQSTRCS